jgi:ketosteroid isomerase-like protein
MQAGCHRAASERGQCIQPGRCCRWRYELAEGVIAVATLRLMRRGPSWCSEDWARSSADQARGSTDVLIGLGTMSQLNSLRIADVDPEPTSSPGRIVQSALANLYNGRIAETIALFADRFTFEDHALDLTFTDRSRLHEYFERALELCPDATVELTSILESGDQVVAEWRLTGTENVVYWRQLNMPIVVAGVSSIRIENGSITRWSDYYDETRARRASLAAFFVDWVES